MSDIQTKPARFKKRYIATIALAGLVATGGTVGALVTKDSTIANNKLTITAPVTTEPVLTVTGSPVVLEFEAGSVNVPDAAATQEFVLENTGNADAAVTVEKLMDFKLPQDVNPGQTAYFKVMNGDVEVFSQELATNVVDSGEVTREDLTVPANSTVTVTAKFVFAQGGETFHAYAKTFPVEFNYIKKTN